MVMKQITLRLPDDLHALLKTVSEQNRRSLHAQVLFLIEQGLQDARIPLPPEGDGPLHA